VENRPGSYEAFLEWFDPDAFIALVARPEQFRRRARSALAAVLAVAVAACCLLAVLAAPARHATAVSHRHHRPSARRFPDRDESLGEVMI
jgi:hypothetical protein